MLQVQVGDEVRIFNVNSQAQRNVSPWEKDLDPGKPGTVVKVGRVLVTVQNEYGQDQVFRLEDGRANDRQGFCWIKTLDQVALDQRRAAALVTIHSAGLSFTSSLGGGLTVGQLETLAWTVSCFSENGEHPVISRCECGGLARHMRRCCRRQGYGSVMIDNGEN